MIFKTMKNIHKIIIWIADVSIFLKKHVFP